MGSWQNEMKERERKLELHLEDVKAKLDVALSRLSNIASGIRITSDNIPDSWDLASVARHTASQGLKAVAKMRERPRY